MGGSYTHRQTEKSSDKVPLFTILCRGLFILFFSLHSYFPKSLLTPNPIHYSKPSTKHHALCILLFIIHSFLFKKKKGGQIEREREREQHFYAHSFESIRFFVRLQLRFV